MPQPKCPACDDTGKCPECAGSGRVLLAPRGTGVDDPAVVTPRVKPCPRCKGTGRCPACKGRPGDGQKRRGPAKGSWPAAS